MVEHFLVPSICNCAGIEQVVVSVNLRCCASWVNMGLRSGKSAMLCLVGAEDRKLDGVSQDTRTTHNDHILFGALEKPSTSLTGSDTFLTQV